MASVYEPNRSYRDLLASYFFGGNTCKEIVEYLRIGHNIRISVRTLQRDLNRFCFKKNGMTGSVSSASLSSLVSAVQVQTEYRAGYRRTWRLVNKELRVTHQHVSQERVRKELLRQNPRYVALRLNRKLSRRIYLTSGPNHLWHCDGYDKLKPYGFAIHGCIDGYSRKVLWVHCGSTNNDPAVILHYYLNTVSRIGGVPTLLRSDCGTENGLIAAAQCTLRDTIRAHIYGTSQHNQRIEAWWSILRKSWTEIWMDLFASLQSFGTLNTSDERHKALLRCCFQDIIRRELKDFVDDWNGHRIRPSFNSRSPPGKPNVLYDLPHLSGGRDMLREVDETSVAVLFCRSTVLDSFEPEQEDFVSLINSTGIVLGETRQERTRAYLILYSILF